MQARRKDRALSLLLSLLMVMGLFTVCWFGAAAGAETAGFLLKEWDASALDTAARTTDTKNEDDGPIYFKNDHVVIAGKRDATGGKGAGWLFHSQGPVGGEGGWKWSMGQTLLANLYLKVDGTPGARVDIVYNDDEANLMQRVFLNSETVAQLEELPVGAIGVSGVKKLAVEIPIDSEGYMVEGKKLQVRIWGEDNTVVTCYGVDILNQDNGVAFWGLDMNRSTEGGDDKTSLVYATGLTSYCLSPIVKGGIPEAERAYSPVVSDNRYAAGSYATNAALFNALDLGALPAGNYALNMDFLTKFGLGERKFTLNLYAGTGEAKTLLKSETVTQTKYLTKGWSPDSGIRRRESFDFTVSEAHSGQTITAELILHNTTWFTLFGMDLCSTGDIDTIQSWSYRDMLLDQGRTTMFAENYQPEQSVDIGFQRNGAPAGSNNFDGGSFFEERDLALPAGETVTLVARMYLPGGEENKNYPPIYWRMYAYGEGFTSETMIVDGNAGYPDYTSYPVRYDPVYGYPYKEITRQVTLPASLPSAYVRTWLVTLRDPNNFPGQTAPINYYYYAVKNAGGETLYEITGDRIAQTVPSAGFSGKKLTADARYDVVGLQRTGGASFDGALRLTAETSERLDPSHTYTLTQRTYNANGVQSYDPYWRVYAWSASQSNWHYSLIVDTGTPGVYSAAPLQIDPIYGYPYKEMTYSIGPENPNSFTNGFGGSKMTGAADMESNKIAIWLTIPGHPGFAETPATFYYFSIYDETAGKMVCELDGADIAGGMTGGDGQSDAFTFQAVMGNRNGYDRNVAYIANGNPATGGANYCRFDYFVKTPAAQPAQEGDVIEAGVWFWPKNGLYFPPDASGTGDNHTVDFKLMARKSDGSEKEIAMDRVWTQADYDARPVLHDNTFGFAYKELKITAQLTAEQAAVVSDQSNPNGFNILLGDSGNGQRDWARFPVTYYRYWIYNKTQGIFYTDVDGAYLMTVGGSWAQTAPATAFVGNLAQATDAYVDPVQNADFDDLSAHAVPGVYSLALDAKGTATPSNFTLVAYAKEAGGTLRKLGSRTVTMTDVRQETAVDFILTADTDVTFGIQTTGQPLQVFDAALTYVRDLTYTVALEKGANVVSLTAMDSLGRPVTSGASVPYGTVLTVYAVPSDGYYLIEGSQQGVQYVTASQTTVTVTDNLALMAEAGLAGYVLSVNHANGAAPSAATDESALIVTDNAGVAAVAEVSYGASVTLTAGEADEGYEFVGWYQSNGKWLSADATLTVGVTGNQTVEARYRTIGAAHTVTFLAEGKTVASFKTDSLRASDYPADPKAPAGKAFTGWSLTVDALNAALATGDVNVVAQFEDAAASVSVSITRQCGDEAAEEIETRLIVPNTVVTVRAEPVDGMNFSCWTLNGEVLTYHPVASFKPTESCTLQAVYQTDETAPQGLASITSATYNSSTNKAVFVAYLTVPENGVIVKAGLVAASSETFNPTNQTLTVANAEYVKSLQQAEGKNAPVQYTWSKSNANAADSWYARGYLVYTDTNGKLQTVYGDLVTVTCR